MAEVLLGNVAMCILPQSGFGTINSTINALTNTAAHASGLIVGVGTTGLGNSGIDAPTHSRDGLALARITNSAQADQFVAETVKGLKVTFPLGGCRNTTSNPTIDADFSPATYWKALDALLQATGLAGAADGTATKAWLYKATGDAVPASIGFWFGGILVLYKDVLVSKLTIKPQPGTIALVEAEFDIPGVVDWKAQALTTITNGAQATACPIVKGVQHSFGTTRSYNSMEIVLSPKTTKLDDSNDTTTGTRLIQTAFDVTAKATIWADDSVNVDMERDTLVLLSAPTTALTFQVGSTTGAASTANTYGIDFNNATVRDVKVTQLGTKVGWDVNLEGNAIGSAGTEFTFRLL
jgi:hypothetical protein